MSNNYTYVVKKQEEEGSGHLATFWFAMIFHAMGALFIMITFEDEWCIFINAYKLTFSSDFGKFFVLSYSVCPCYPYILSLLTLQYCPLNMGILILLITNFTVLAN